MAFKLANKQKSVTVILLFLIAIMFSLLSYFTPYAFDDWVFMAEWRDVNGPSSSPTLSAFLKFWRSIRLVDNGRLANTFSPLFSLFSPWKELFPFLTGICASAIIGFVACFSFGKRQYSPIYIILSWGFIFFLLPWRNSLFVADYSLNYIWAAALTMTFMAVVMFNEKHDRTLSGFILNLVLAFFAGGWHEGFAVATLTGFILYTVLFFRQRHFSAQWYLTGIFYAVVAACFCLSPGIIARSGNELGVANPGWNIIKLAADFLPVLLLVMLMAIYLAFPFLRHNIYSAFRNPWFVIGIGIVISGCTLSLIFTHQPRSAFWPDIFAVIMIFILTQNVWERIAHSHFSVYLASIACVAIMLPMALIISLQSEYKEEAEMLTAKIINSPDGTVYHDIIPASSLPIYTLKIPTHNLWITPFQFQGIKKFSGKPYPAVIPTELSGSDIKLERISKENPHIFRAGNSLVMDMEADGEPTLKTVLITSEAGEKVYFPALFLPYQTPYGSVYTYVSVYGIPVEEISDISLI